VRVHEAGAQLDLLRESLHVLGLLVLGLQQPLGRHLLAVELADPDFPRRSL
jgi:hypothetical protein